MEKVVLDSLIKRITRGILIKSSELDNITSEEKTNNSFVRIKNIENGLFTGDMIYLTKIDDKYKKYCINDNNLVISKIGKPYKVCVAKVEKGQNLLASGNLFILKLDLDKVDPYYLASYLSSDKGTKLLDDITAGSVIPSLVMSQFRALEIDVPSMDEQIRIGKIYLDTVNKIKELQNMLQDEIESLKHIVQ